MKMLDKLIQRAESVALRNPNYGKARIACALLRNDGVIVAFGNRTVTDRPVPTHHAEARALRKATPNAIIVVIRIMKDGVSWGCAKPCEHCHAKIVSSRVAKVYYSTGIDKQLGCYIPNSGVNHVRYQKKSKQSSYMFQIGSV